MTEDGERDRPDAVAPSSPAAPSRAAARSRVAGSPPPPPPISVPRLAPPAALPFQARPRGVWLGTLAPSPPPALPVSAQARRSPYADLSTHHRTVVGGAFDLLTKASPDIRSASLYAGLIVLITSTPAIILVLRLVAYLTAAGIDLSVLDPTTLSGPFLTEEEGAVMQAVSGPLVLATYLALGGFVAAAIDSRAMMASILGARLAGRRLTRHDALKRARTTFWRVLAGTFVIGIPVNLAQTSVAELYRGEASLALDFADVAALLTVAVVAAPFTYILAGMVLGDVGPIAAIRRSITLFRARVGAGLIVALFAVAGQFIILAGLAVGADLLVRGFDALDLDLLGGGPGAVVAVVVILVFVFAIGSLLATVAAVEIAPQVLMFAALTHVAPGLERIDERAPAPRILTRPMLVVEAIGLIALVAGLAALAQL